MARTTVFRTNFHGLNDFRVIEVRLCIVFKSVMADSIASIFNSYDSVSGLRLNGGTCFNKGIKHVFSCIHIRQVPREVLKTEAGSRGFQHLPRDLPNVNALENHVRSLLLHKNENFCYISLYFLHYFVSPFHRCLANAISTDYTRSRAEQYTSRNGSKSVGPVRSY